MGKYCHSNAPELEARLEAFLERLAARIGALPESREIAAVLLGGGYGRGEGGVFRKPDGDAELFNDLDFFVISRPLPRRRRKALDCAMREFGKGFDEEIGVDVDFGPARSAGELEHMPYTLMWQELRAGCRLVWGDPACLERWRLSDWSLLPVSEAARLLLNRAAGLLLAAAKLDEDSAENRRFAARNLFKALLAIGDARLILTHNYRARAQERSAALAEDSGFPAALLDGYRRALAYKFEPCELSAEELNREFPAALKLFREFWWSFWSELAGAFVENAGELEAYLRLAGPFPEDRGRRERMKNPVRRFRCRLPLVPYFRQPRYDLYVEISSILLEKVGLPRYIDRNGASGRFLYAWERCN